MKKLICVFLLSFFIYLPVFTQTGEARSLHVLKRQISLLANNLFKNATFKPITGSVVITTIQNLNNLKQTNDLGRLISECLIHELQIRGFQIKDIRMVPEIVASPKKGEFILTRNPQKLKKEIDVNYLLTGTYSVADEGVVINIRLLDLKTGLVVSTAQTIIPLNDVAFLLHDSTAKAPKIKIVGEGEE